MKYTFGKASRFPSISHVCPLTGYDLPDPKNKRAAGFGYGDKKLFKPQLKER